MRASKPAKDRATHRSERGQSLVELGVSFVVLVILLSVMIDGGRAFFSYLALREAAEEGAVYGAINPTDTTGIENRVRSNSSAPVDLADTGTVFVTPVVVGASCANGSNQVQVTVSYTFDLTMPFIGAVLGTSQFPISLTATSTILTPEC